MTSRGQDGSGVWISDDRRLGLAHRRLAIIDLSPTGAQPMFDDTGMLAIVFNGEIYNYRELRAQLKKAGCRFRSTSDTEVLLHLYAEQGVSMLDSLRGMYAFVLWDSRKKALFLARDPYGIKPLYYADDGHSIRAASQVKALLAGGGVDTAPDPAGHVGFFLLGHIPDPHTLYRNIRAVPAGTFVWMEKDKRPREVTFCSIPRIFSDVAQNGDRSEVSSGPSESRSCADTVRQALRDTVRHHLIADVPVGLFLSSGLDSTTLAALVAEEGGALRTVTLGFAEYKGTPNDETPLAEEVARRYGAEHRAVWVTRRDFNDRLDDLFWSMDQPTTDGVNTYWVSRAAQQSGLKVALSGLGGDELFGGYPSFHQVPSLVSALRPFRALRPLARGFRILSAPLLKHFTSPKYAGLLEYGGSVAGAYLLRRGLFMPWELPSVLDGDMVRAGWQELQPLAAIEQGTSGMSSPRAMISCLESTWYMRNQLLRDADWAGMAHSLEIRVPLVDIELLRSTGQWIASRTPPSKRTLSQAPRRPLPENVQSRPKTGFGVPIREWLLDSAVTHGHSSESTNGRGLRDWARVVYGQFSS